MFEIIVAIIAVVCIIYFFKGEFVRKDVGVTVLKSLPLSIFKKWVKEEDNIEEIKNIKQKVAVEISNKKVKVEKNINDRNSEILNEVSITILNEKNENVEVIDIEDNIDEANSIEEIQIIDSVETTKEIEENRTDEFNNSLENLSNTLLNEYKDTIESKEIVEKNNKETEELVFWTPRGKTYHVKSTCRTLARSKLINSGTVYESGKDFKCEHCK